MRKAKEVAQAKSSGGYMTPACLVASLGYAPMKASKLPSSIAVVLWLPEKDESERPAAIVERIGSLLPAVQRVLMADGDVSPPGAIFMVDCTPLIPAGRSLKSALDAEGTTSGPLGKDLGKPVGRLLEKMLAGYKGSVSLVAFEGGAQLALRLLQAPETDRGLKEGIVERLVLLRPRLSGAAVNALLPKPVRTKMSVDVYYESAAAREKRDVMLRHAYALGASRILPNPSSSGARYHGVGLCTALLNNSGDATAAAEAAASDALAAAMHRVDPEAADLVGQSVFWSELSYEIDRDTKQPRAILMDLDPYEMAEAAQATQARRGPPAPAPSAPTPCEGGDGCADSCEHAGGHLTNTSPGVSWAGALVLRGNRCVLVRTLGSPSLGMCIPFAELRAGESAVDGAVRAASDSCDIDGPAELELMQHVPPAALYIGDGTSSDRRCVLVYAFYAVQPPPEGPLEVRLTRSSHCPLPPVSLCLLTAQWSDPVTGRGSHRRGRLVRLVHVASGDECVASRPAIRFDIAHDGVRPRSGRGCGPPASQVGRRLWPGVAWLPY